jgi:putative transposase
MRSRYRVLEEDQAHFVTSTILEWLPVFTTPACCDILVGALEYCRAHKGLRVHGWVIMDNHFHAVISGPDLPGTMQSLKRHTARALLEQLTQEGRDWLIERLAYSCARQKRIAGSRYQVWQEGYHPQSIRTDEVMLQKLRYIHLNPVRRGHVLEPEHWRYSSAHEWLTGSSPAIRVDECR